MIDFKQELDKLLEKEPQPLPEDELPALLLNGQKALDSLGKRQSELSIQLEEIYDIVGNMDTAVLQDALLGEKQRVGALVGAAVGLCDLLEDFLIYAQGSGDEELYKQARIMWSNSDTMLQRCGLARLGEEGQQLNPEIHNVRSATRSPLPREHVARVLQSGYRYLGMVVRKAAVILSKGMETTYE